MYIFDIDSFDLKLLHLDASGHMKQIYWRPLQISRLRLTMLTLASIMGWLICQWRLVEDQQPFFIEKKQAAEKTQKAFDVVKKAKQTNNIPIDPTVDPLQTGLIGLENSIVTTDFGSLPAKRTSVNANFSALIVQWLYNSGVQAGDSVAIGMSGSFPALNIAVLSALEVLHVQALYIVSTSGSQWGANQPDFMWPDMLAVLQQERIITSEPLAISRGGIGDCATGMSKQGVDTIDACMKRSKKPIIDETNFERNLDLRMNYYLQAAKEHPIKAYINIGGGTASVGSVIGKKIFQPGLNHEPPKQAQVVDSIMQRFADMGVPVIHLVQIKQIAENAQLIFDADQTILVGQGPLFYTHRYSRLTIVCVLMTLFGLMLMASRNKSHKLKIDS